MRLVCVVLCLMAALQMKAQAYFQQRADHVISVRLDDSAHVIAGSIETHYYNNSPQSLDTLWYHLWPNSHANNSTALAKELSRSGSFDLWFAKKEDRGLMDSLAFRVNDSETTWGYHPKHHDIAWLHLKSPLRPGERCVIFTPFRFHLPKAFSRFGHTGQAYSITQWYPKPALFDVNGWHVMPYLDQGEFYSDFGSFDVSITLPSNYVVGATGRLQSARERAWLDSLAAAPTSGGNTSDAFPPSSANVKTLRYLQDSVHDFAWFADKRFLVRKRMVEMPSGRSIEAWALFTPAHAQLWENAAEYVAEAVRFYSQWVGEYPFAACTAVDGTVEAGGGMEYPMITMIGEMGTTRELDNVIAHEVGHNWFQGMLATNEREYPWMDEGMNSAVELQYMRARYTNAPEPPIGGILGTLLGSSLTTHDALGRLGYRLNARRNLDQSGCLGSTSYTRFNYGTVIYAKVSAAMDHLLAYLGETRYVACLHAYFDQWAFRHPAPADLRAVFERTSGENLGWCFDGLICSNEDPDLRARRMGSEGVRCTNTSREEMPTPITAYAGEDSLGTLWTKLPPGRSTLQLPWPNATGVRMDATTRTLDIDHRNNGAGTQRSHVRLRPFMGVEKPDERTYYYTPLPAWNAHDGWQIGTALYNTTIPSQSTEFVLVPLYSGSGKRAVGSARVEHHFDHLSSRLLRNVHVGASVRSASTLQLSDRSAWYLRYQGTLRLDLVSEPLAKPMDHQLCVRVLRLDERSEATALDGLARAASEVNDYLELKYELRGRHGMRPAHAQLVALYHADFTRLNLEASFGSVYNTSKKRIDMRAFVGGFLRTEELAPLQAWRLSWGAQDLLYDHAFLARGGGDRVFEQQFAEQQGAFRSPTLLGRSDTWIASMNVEADAPLPLPLAAFMSAGAVPTRTVTMNGTTEGTRFLWEAGIGLRLLRDAFEVWFPLAFSQAIQEEFDGLRAVSASERVRFVLALEMADATRILRNLRP
jgi:Peptidase family M1 domain